MENETRITLVAADDHRIFLDGLETLLREIPGIVFEGTAENGEDLLALIGKVRPDIALVDITLHKENGIELVKAIRERSVSTKVIMLTMHGTRDYITDALEAGVNGYILKNTGKDELFSAIHKVAAGETWYSPKVTEVVMKSFAKDDSFKEGRTRLTRREEEILRLVCREMTSQEIADKLCISLLTVETHRKNMLSKLGVKNTAGLVKQAIELGLA